jgi:hypothetical protein
MPFFSLLPFCNTGSYQYPLSCWENDILPARRAASTIASGRWKFFYIEDVHPADGDDHDDYDDGEAAVTIPHNLDNESDDDDEYIRSGQCVDDVFNSTPIGIARPSRLDCPCDTVPKALAVAGGNRPGRAAARRQSWTTIGPA